MADVGADGERLRRFIDQVLLLKSQLVVTSLTSESRLFGLPDATWGETPVAFIELKGGVPPPTAADILAWCRQRLARYKCPRHVVFADLPKTSTGKIQKFVLRERAKEV